MGRLEEEHLVNNPLERIRMLEIQLEELQRNALTSVESVGGVTDHGSLTGLSDDDHTQYVLADGSRAFTGTVGGVTPSAASDLATKGYVDTAPWTDHGNLTGLGDDDHSQYVHISSARTITAQHAFAPTSTQAPFTLGANAQGQLVTGLNADKVDGYDLNQGVSTTDSPTFAGVMVSGLTASRLVATNGSKALASVNNLASWVAGTANQVYVTNDGDGTITLSGPQDLNTSSSPTFAGVTVSGLTASRLVATNGSKALASVSNLTSWIGGTANQVYVTNDGDGTITLSGPQDLNTSSSPTFAGITVNGNASMRHVLPQATDTYDLGSQTLLWRKGYLSEMEAVLFAENTITLIGGWLYVCKYAGTVEEDVDDSETAIDLGVSDSVLSANDFIVLRSSLQVEYMQLTSYAGSNIWNVTRDVDGSGANTWPQGSPFAVLGYDGDGRIEFSAYDTPRASIVGQGTSYNSQTEYVRMGDLNGMADYTSQAFGIFIGDYAADSWMAYDPTNGLRMDGSAIIDGTIQATSFTTDLNAMFFSSSDGLLLLGPGCRITPTEWESTRGEVATISGAFHQVTGRWPGTHAILAEPATTNYCIAPRMIEDGATGLADGWSYNDNFGSGGSATQDVVAHPIAERGWLQRLTYTASAGDSGDYCQLIDRTSSGTFAQNDYITLSLDIKGEIDGAIARLVFWERDSGDVAGTAHAGGSIALTDSIQRVVLTAQAVDSDCDHLSFGVQIYSVDNGDSFDVYIGAVNVEKTQYATQFCCGALGWCSWSGTEDDSTSTRTDTEINLDDHVGLISGNDTISVSLWVQMPYDYDDFNRSGGIGTIFFSAGGGSNSLAIQYNTNTYKFRLLAGASGNVSLYSSEQSFSAGDWMHIVTTSDFSSNEHKMYINGVLDGTDTTSESAPTLTDWELGSVNGSTQYGWAICECAVFDTVLDDDEVAAIFYRNSPLVDSGALNKPGIYIWDGAFSLASSTSGARVEIDLDGIRAYSDETSNPQSVAIDVDGDMFLGSDVSDPSTTTIAILANAQTYASVAYGAGDILIGNPVAGDSEANLWWDASSGDLIVRSGTTKSVTFGADRKLTFFDSLGNTVGEVYGNAGGGGVFVAAASLSLYSRHDTSNRAVELLAGVGGYYNGVAISAGTVDWVNVYVNNSAIVEVTASSVTMNQDLLASQDVRISGGLYVGGVGTDPDDDDVWCDGEISTDGGTTRWNLGGYTSGAPTADGYVTISINGSTYRFACEAV